MTPTRDPVAVVGAGPAGLFQALYLSKVRGRNVVLIEQQETVGGILRGGQAPWGPVDQGAYIFQECGIAALDDLFFDALPLDEWHILDGVRRDIGGNHFAGRIDTGSLFPDLRRLPAEDYRRCLDELKRCAEGRSLSIAEAPTLAAYLTARFGPHAVSCFYDPLTRKFWKNSPETLSAAAAAMVHMTRVVAYDMKQSLAMKQSPGWNAILGVPDQLAFPLHLLSSSKRCLYPRSFGTINVVNGLVDALRRHGVQILTGTKITGLETADNAVTGLQVTSRDGARTVAVSGVLWASANPPLLGLMGLPVAPPAHPPVPHRLVHLLLDHVPQTGPLYWLWSYDPDTSWVRLSSGAAYCPDAARDGRYPICVETHIPAADTAPEEVVAQVEREMRAAHLISDATKVVAAYVQPGAQGYFVPSLGNCASLDAQRKAIERHAPVNLCLTGQDVAAGVFFLPDVLSASLSALDRL